MTAKERKRLKDLERKVHDLEAHQLHLSPYRCPYCVPWHFVPWTPAQIYPHLTTVGPSETFDLTSQNPTVTTYEMPQTTFDLGMNREPMLDEHGNIVGSFYEEV